MSTATIDSSKEKTFMGHPIGLFVLFFTEMWERFSYYGMRALLVLYMASSVGDGGLGWTKAESLALYGWYTMLVYVMSIPGGIIADKVLGQKKSVLYGAIILVAGHGILAIEEIWAFYTGLLLIILGVGMLKPNISTMVGGLYKQGDIRRDKGFTLFYIGINIGAFLAAIIVGYVGQHEDYGWHYGFGLAGIGMLLGLVVYMWGQKYLTGVGNLVVENTKVPLEDDQDILDTAMTDGRDENLFASMFKDPLTAIIAILSVPVGIGLGYFVDSTLGFFLGVFLFMFSFFKAMFKNLNSIEKDRVKVMLISFLIIIVFWGAFEQAGGLLNIYANEKVDLNIFGWEMPATWFQSFNAFFIVVFGTLVAGFWANRKLKGRETSTLLKMGIGTIIMGLGFLLMVFASDEASAIEFGTASFWWLTGAYLLHTIGELCASPTALSFITKLSPVKYASIMMGVYFAATGFGNKLAGSIGEASQSEPAKIELVASVDELAEFDGVQDKIKKDESIAIRSKIYLEDGDFKAIGYKNGVEVKSIFKFSEESQKDEIISLLKENEATKENPYHATFKFEKDSEAKKIKKNKGDGKDYGGKFIIEEVQSQKEHDIFLFIFILTAVFGLLVIALLKPLKRLTHGAEDNERKINNDEAEGFELAD